MAANPEIKSENGFFTGATELAQYLVGNGAEIERAKIEAEQKTMLINGVEFFWNRNNHRWEQLKAAIPDDAPVPEPLVFFTLAGIIDYIKENCEGLIPVGDIKIILHVVNQSLVKLMSHPSENRKVRNCIAICEAHAPKIEFERYMDVDTFNTMLLSKFVETEARKALFGVVKSLTKNQDCNVSDDGVTQVLTVKQGVSMAANVQFQNPVPLKPMRTFTEIDQPESNFTLRVNENANAALFEADGGAWKNVAVARIKNYLKNNLHGHNVVVIA